MEVRRIGGGILAAASVVGGVVMDRAVPDTLTTLQSYGLWGFLAVRLFVGLALALWPSRPREVAGAPMGDDNSIKIGTISGGQIGHIGNVFASKPQRRLSDTDKAEMNIIPAGDTVEVADCGDNEAYQVAEEIAAHLRATGRNVQRSSVMASFPPVPPGTRAWKVSENRWKIEIGPNG